MSTYWGYRCETCDENSDTFFNHGERELSTLARHYMALSPLMGLSIIRIDPIRSDVLIFLEDHSQHVLVLRNEYGKVMPLLPDPLDAAAAQAAPRWIPVAERLPEWRPDRDNSYPVAFPSFINNQPTIGAAEITRDREWIDPASGGSRHWCDLITHWLDVQPPNDPT